MGSRLGLLARASLVVWVGSLALAATQCRPATSLRVASYSEVPCTARARVALVVAHELSGLRDAVPSAVSTTCGPAGGAFVGEFDMGTVVIAPTGSPDDVLVLALMTRPDGEAPETCVDPAQAAKCITARRRVRFSPHEDTALPIELRLSCLGVVCPAEQTCRKGQCVAAEVPTGCEDCVETKLAPATVPSCGSMSGLQPGSPWPMPGYCPTRAGRSGRNGPQSPTVRWSFKMGGISSMSPTVAADGTIYVGSNEAVAFAIDPNGREKWRTALGRNVNGSGFVIGTDGTVFVGVANANIYALAPGGSIKWTSSAGSDVQYPPIIGVEGTLYAVGNAEFGPAQVHAMATADGKVKWRSAANFGVGALSLGQNSNVYVGGVDAKLYALAPTDGTPVWSAPMAGSPRAISIADDGTVVVADGVTVDAYTPTGTRKWRTPVDGDSRGLALGADGTAYVPTSKEKLVAVAPDGSVRWSFDGAFTEQSPIVGGDGTIYASGFAGAVFAITPDGKLRWKANAGNGDLYSQPAIGADGTLYVVSTDFNLYAIGP